MTGRDAFLARVRSALAAGGARDAVPATPPHDPSLVRRVEPGPDTADRFAGAAEAAGVHVHRTRPGQVSARLQDILVALGARTAAASVGAAWTATVAEATAAAGCTLADWRAGAGLDTHYDVAVGITDVEAAVAESGTLVLGSGPAHSRGTFLVPPVHVAIVRTDQIRPDLVDVWAHVRETESAATVLVTGPSKTADIEGILITGVHGPGTVHVVLVDRDEGPTG